MIWYFILLILSTFAGFVMGVFYTLGVELNENMYEGMEDDDDEIDNV